MHTQRILEFSTFLARQPKSYNEIARFLVMNTFSEEKFSAVSLSELIETGDLCPIGGFGWASGEYEALAIQPIQSNHPLCVAIRDNDIITAKLNEGLTDSCNLLAEVEGHPDWATVVAIPAHPIGGISLFSTLEIAPTEALRVFFIAIGSLLGLYASRLPRELVEVALNVKKEIDLPAIPLSDRQLVIAGLLERGFNNAEIGLEIGYSESLIRQETVAIYRKLNVTGRKAMQAIRTLHLENHPDIEIIQ